MRVGLVLGAGGVLGGSWLVGGLHALAEETGWDPGSAEHIVGTSAGSMVGAFVAAGVPPWFMLAHSAGEDEDEELAAGEEDDGAKVTRAGGAVYRLHRGLPALGPGSWRLAVASLARPYRYSPAAVLAGWLPQGLVSSEPLKETVRRVTTDPWAPHPNLWIMACDYETGSRVAFGRGGSPPAALPDAVAASCAIPGFYKPVRITGAGTSTGECARRRTSTCSPTASSISSSRLNPTSSLHAPSSRTVGDRAAAVMRQASGRRLGSEAKRLIAAGTEVVLVQPTVQDLDAMGSNLMSAKRRHRVIETATQTVARHLREPEVRARLRDLPEGHPALVRRPEGPMTRPDFAHMARSRWGVAAVA